MHLKRSVQNVRLFLIRLLGGSTTEGYKTIINALKEQVYEQHEAQINLMVENSELKKDKACLQVFIGGKPKIKPTIN